MHRRVEKGAPALTLRGGRVALGTAAVADAGLQQRKSWSRRPLDSETALANPTDATRPTVARGAHLVQKGSSCSRSITIYEANLQRANAEMSSAQARRRAARASRDPGRTGPDAHQELREQQPQSHLAGTARQTQTAFDIAEANQTAATHLVEQARGAPGSAAIARQTHLIAPMAAGSLVSPSKRARSRCRARSHARPVCCSRSRTSRSSRPRCRLTRRRRTAASGRFGPRVTIDAFPTRRSWAASRRFQQALS